MKLAGEEPEAWRRDAACRGMDPDTFYPRDRDTLAAAVCEGCPVREPCGEYGIAHEEYGVYGGLSEQLRRRIRSERGIVLRAPADPIRFSVGCGTHNGYLRHYRNGTAACTSCKAAHAAYVGTRAQRQKRAVSG